MNRVLQAIENINNTSTAEDVDPSKINSKGAEIIGQMDDAMQSFYSNFTDWHQLADTMQDQRHGTVAVAKIKYPINQVLQALWQAVYGNRTKEELARGEQTDRPSVRFSAFENMNYRSSLVSSLDQPEEGAEQGPDLADETKVVNAFEGELRFGAMKPLLDAFMNLYQLTCDETWEYTPWNEVDKRKANTASVASALMRARGRLPAAE